MSGNIDMAENIITLYETKKIVLEKKESGNMSKTMKNWVFCIVDYFAAGDPERNFVPLH